MRRKCLKDGKPPREVGLTALYFWAGSRYDYSMEIKTKVRRTHLGLRYDLFVDGVYSATAHDSREWAIWINRLESKYQ